MWYDLKLDHFIVCIGGDSVKEITKNHYEMPKNEIHKLSPTQFEKL